MGREKEAELGVETGKEIIEGQKGSQIDREVYRQRGSLIEIVE